MASIKLFAGTNIGLRDNNEDNFIVCPDLTKDEWMVPANQQESIPLGSHGALVVVADGMGGMNAGEVASDIAVSTVRQMFAPSSFPADIVDKPDAVMSYLKKVIVQADLNVKQRCKEEPETEGMGSTIVVGWLMKDKVYVGWLGDSRAYLYSPSKGIERLSKDHSFVQQLVDSKMLTAEEAMNHPDSNVITRSLGDTSQKAKPDVTVHSVGDGDIILLCSDGLCGVCTDEEILDILKQDSGDLRSCKEALTTAALEAGGSDNITVSLLQVVEAGVNDTPHHGTWWRSKPWWCVCLVALCLAVLAIVLLGRSNDVKPVGIESIELKLSNESMSYGDSISYEVRISPQETEQSYVLECDNKDVCIDTISHKILLKKDVQGKALITAASIADSTKRDTAQVKISKRSVNQDETSTKQNDASIILSINRNEPLESGKSYAYSIVFSPASLANNGYNIRCSSAAVTINKKAQTIEVSDALKDNTSCTFTISAGGITMDFVYQLKGTDMTKLIISASTGESQGSVE